MQQTQLKKSWKKSFAGIGAGMMLVGTAGAQSSVTLYGIVDSGVTYTNNQQGHSAWQATAGNESGPRWGMLGTEDLGGGLKANFRLENGFNLENGAAGQGGRMFGRQAWVGMSGDKLGALTLGRQYNTVQDILGSIQISNTLVQYSTHPFDNDDINNTFRTNNAVKYVSPTIAGLQTNLMYGFSNATGFAANNSWSAGVSYTHGPLNAGAAYARMNQPASSAAGAVASDNYFASSAAVFGTHLGAATRQQIWGRGRNLRHRARHAGAALHGHGLQHGRGWRPALRQLRGQPALRADARVDRGRRLHVHPGVARRRQRTLSPGLGRSPVPVVQAHRRVCERPLPERLVAHRSCVDRRHRSAIVDDFTTGVRRRPASEVLTAHARHLGKDPMKLRFLLAALPFIGIYSGGSLAAGTPLLFGLPFLLVWNLFWMAATAVILAIIYFLDTRDEAAQAAEQTGGGQ
jgi:Outer membrane protein (porin)